MNKLASASQRTGQPRCVQLMEKAMKVSAFTRRSHAALRAVTPAHGNGEASSYCTAVVSPILKDSTFPTERQTSCLRFKKRRENKTDHRHRQNQRADPAKGETQAREKFSPRKFRWRGWAAG